MDGRGRIALVGLISGVLLGLPLIAAAEEGGGAPGPSESASSGAEPGREPLPAMAARRYRLVEPIGFWPSPWAALSAAVDGGATLDGELAWTAIRVHVPVINRYGAVDFRLEACFNGERFISLDPELVLRGLPFRWAEGRGVLGFALSMASGFLGDEPTMRLGGGLVGGYAGRWWFIRAYVGARGDVLQGLAVEVVGHLGLGLTLPHGFRPQVEVDVIGEAERGGEVSLVVRPALRYWPVGWIGIGLSGDIWALGPELASSALRLDVVLQAQE